MISKVHLASIVWIFTGHCPIDFHAVRVKILTNAICQYCKAESEVKASSYFLLHCPAFARLRLKYLGSLTVGEPRAETNITRLNKFVMG